MRPWLAAQRSLEALNRLAEERNLVTESGRPVRFVAPGAKDAYYEVKVYETGCVETRPDSLHDWFNALAWLAFPRTKARINAMHAAEIPHERGRRGPLRDLLTIFDEGGAIVRSDDAELVSLLQAFEWKKLFWERRAAVRAGLKVLVLGHATLEQALEPRPGITCKAIFIPAAADPDAAACEWLSHVPAGASPRDLAPLPVFGYPGWLEQSAALYDDARYFRPRPVKSHAESARQPLRRRL